MGFREGKSKQFRRLASLPVVSLTRLSVDRLSMNAASFPPQKGCTLPWNQNEGRFRVRQLPGQNRVSSHYPK